MIVAAVWTVDCGVQSVLDVTEVCTWKALAKHVQVHFEQVFNTKSTKTTFKNI